MCDTIIPQQLTEITFEWFIFLRFYPLSARRLPPIEVGEDVTVILKYSYNITQRRIFSHTHKQNNLYTKHTFVL